MAARFNKKPGNKMAARTTVSNEWPWDAALVAAVVITYVPVWWAQFAWDDRLVFAQNPVVVGPLGLKEIWTTAAADICPFTLTTFWLEHLLWGTTPLPYHLVNVALHIAAALMLWRVLRAMSVPGAWFGAALWALHPVQVESVAWVSEMKNTESALFFLCSIFFYLRVLIGEKPGASYALTLLFAALAMASKSSTVILPLVLMLVGWWMRGRWTLSGVVKLVPMFAMSMIAGVVTMWTQRQQEMTFNDIPDTRSALQRLLSGADAIWFYLGKLIWPVHLMPIYPHWQIDAGDLVAYFPLVALLAGCGVLVAFRNRPWAGAILLAVGYFIVALLPTLGIAGNAFSQFSYVSDHFQYLADMGPLGLLGAAFSTFAERRLPGAAWAGPMYAGALLFVLGLLSCLQATIYRDDIQLWTYNVNLNPQCWIGYNNLGVDYSDQQKIDQAIAAYRAAVRARPDYALAWSNLALNLVAENQTAEAEADYLQAIKFNPNSAISRRNYGDLLVRENRTDEALQQYDKSIAINPTDPDSHNDRAVALTQKGDIDGAIREMETALQLAPNFPNGLSNLNILRQMKAKNADGH
jgi:tetratricopeptide (TPR) repeat protein